MAELLTQARTLAAALDGLGWAPRGLDSDAVTRLFFQRWNPRQFEAGASPRPCRRHDPVPFAERFAQSDFRWDPNGRALPAGMAELDGWMHAILTLYEPPEDLARPAFDDLLLLSGLAQAELVVNVERGDRLQRMKRLRTLLQQRQSDPADRERPGGTGGDGAIRGGTGGDGRQFGRRRGARRAIFTSGRPTPRNCATGSRPSWRWPARATPSSSTKSGPSGPIGGRCSRSGRRRIPPPLFPVVAALTSQEQGFTCVSFGSFR